MSASIFRITYNSIPGVFGRVASDFLDRNLNMGENGNYYITLEAVETLEAEAQNSEEREIAAALRKEVEEQDEFDLTIV